MEEKIDVIFDSDPGKDDAFAIFLALAAPERLNVLAIIAAAGNLGLDVTSVAARRIVEAAGRPEIPVYCGCPNPLLGPLVTLPQHHGQDGLGGSQLPAMVRPPMERHGVHALIELIDNAKRPVTLAAIAPLTNVAIAFALRPDLPAKLERLVVMGGGRSGGNMTDFAEFNIYVDPYAAQMVFHSGAPITLVPLDITRPTLPDPSWFASFADKGPPGQAIAGMWRDGALPLHDVVVTAYLLWPDLFETERCSVEVDLSGGPQMARTIIDSKPDGAIDVMAGIDRERLYANIESTLRY